MKGESRAKARYRWYFCAGCRRKLENLGYIITESGRAPVWRNCALCGNMQLIEPADLCKPPQRYRKRTGAGERARAGRK